MNEEGIKVSAIPILVLTCFNLRSYPMKAEVKAEWNFEQSSIKSNKIGNRYL